MTHAAAKVEPLDVAADEHASDDDQQPSQRHLLASERPNPTSDMIDPFHEQLISADE